MAQYLVPVVRSGDGLSFTTLELFGAFGGETMTRAMAIAHRGGVQRHDASANGTRIVAKVVGDQGRTYHQTIALSRTAEKLQVRGYCTCPMGQNCKHVAAALLVSVIEADAAKERTEPKLTGTALAAPAPARLGLLAATKSWLDRIERLAEPSTVAVTATNARQLRYVLDTDTSRATPGLARLRVATIQFGKDGKPRDERPVDPSHWDRLKKQGAKYLSDGDASILRDLTHLAQRNGYPTSGVPLLPDLGTSRLLERLLATGRLHHLKIDGPVLRFGPEERAVARWVKQDAAHQQLAFVSPDGEMFDAVLALDPPHYVRFAAAEIGPIISDLPKDVAVEVARAPIIGAGEAALVKEALGRHKSSRRARAVVDSSTVEEPMAIAETPLLPLPEASEQVETRRLAPVPQLHLFTAKISLKRHFSQYAPNHWQGLDVVVPLVSLSFRYGDHTVGAGVAGDNLEHLDGNTLVIIPRDRDAEAKASQRLTSLRFLPFAKLPMFDPPRDAPSALMLDVEPGYDSYGRMDVLDEPHRFVLFADEEIPRLEKASWQVTYADGYPYRLAEGDASFWADTDSGSGIDWFSFELGIVFEGQRVNIVPQLTHMLKTLPSEILDLRGDPAKFDAAAKRIRMYVTLPDKRLLPLPGERIAPMLRGLLELIGPRPDRVVDGKVKLHRAEAAALAGVAGELKDVAWAASAERLLDLGKSLRRGRALKPISLPKTFKATLRDYQAEGVAWLDFLRDAGFGGVLADDMGLGKTVQGLAFLSREKAAGRLDKPALIVAPTSVLPNWQAEAERFAPELKVLPLRGLDRRERFGEIATSDIVLTTYPLLVRDFDMIAKQEFHVAILDEAQAIKNPKATVSQVAHRINARHRLALTGTPLENNLGEVWSLFEFLSPGLLGDESTFKRVFRTPIEKHGDQAAQGFLSRRLKPFMLRRTKQQVAKELPPKTEIVERIQLEGAQRDLYETVRVLMEKRVREEIDKKGLAKSHIIFLDALLKLRQICCDPRLLKMDAARKVKESAKLERLMELVPEMVAEGRKILIFSQFTSMLDLIEEELRREKIDFVTIRGDTKDRSAPVKAFQAGKVPVFLLSLKAGGTGLNLTAADTVIHYDPWWNPAVENQATDRAYRIGQDKPVFVHKLIVEEGIEDAIELLKKKKAALAEALFEGSTRQPLQLTEADVSALFAPLSRERTRKAA